MKYPIDRRERIALGGMKQTMPYYIFQGRLDNNTPASLVQEFYDSIEVPDKDLIWFEHSAQSIVVIACALLLGKGADGTGAATSEGVQSTALVACIFVACALGIYFFYNDKEIAGAIKADSEANKE